MKTLENYGAQVMNSNDEINIEGGGFLAWLLGAAVGVMSNAGEGLEASGFNSAGANK